MKVFISWSGSVSFQVAKVLKEWIPCVIQDVEPYFSSEDIDKGARWSTDIAKELEIASFGILCVTKDNLESQWLNFEAGALSKAIDKSKVCPLLFHLKPSDISNSPILQFQMTNIEKDDIYKLLKSINSSLGENKLDETRLEKVFLTFWPEMEKEFNSIEDAKNISKSHNNEENNFSTILEEMLDLLRSQQMILKNPEKILPNDYIKQILSTVQRDYKLNIREIISPRIMMEYRRRENNLNHFLEESDNYMGQAQINEMKIAVSDYMTSIKKIFISLGIINYGVFNLNSYNYNNEE